MRSVIIVGPGPYTTKKDLDNLKAVSRYVDVVSVNAGTTLISDPEIVYSSDHQWWLENYRRIPKMSKGWTCCWKSCIQFGLRFIAPNPEYEEWQWGTTLCLKEGIINTAGNSGFAAINLCYHLGYKIVGLLGIDAKSKNGKSRIVEYPDYYNSNDWGTNGTWAKSFKDMSESIKYSVSPQRFKVVNLGQESPLEAFEKVSWKQFLRL